MKFTIIKSCLACFSGIFALGTPSNIHGTAISYRCAKFGAFVNSVTILTLRDLTKEKNNLFFAFPSLALHEKCRVRLAWLNKAPVIRANQNRYGTQARKSRASIREITSLPKRQKGIN